MRTVLITGAASGIGEAIARRLSEGGDRVVLADRDPRVADLARQLGTTSSVLDVRDTAAVNAWVSSEPHAEALVTSAGVCVGEPLIDSSDEDWETVLDINLMGTVRCLRAFARNRIAAGGGGAAILIASNNAFWPARGLAQYCASKAGVLMAGKVAASELGEHGIRVNVVAPGETDTPMTHAVLEDGAAEEIVRRTPLGRVGRAADIGSAVRALLSEDSAWITGQLISVDGGISLRGESDLTTVARPVGG